MTTEEQIYSTSPLFRGIGKDCWADLFHCLQASKLHYSKGETIFATDEKAQYLGLILQGFVTTEYLDYEGNRNIIASMGVGEIIGDAYSCSKGGRYLVDIVSQCEVTILLISVEKIIHSCVEAQKYQVALLSNLNQLLADKYVTLSRKSLINSERTTREKLLAYFYEQSKIHGDKPFAIPFTQQQLADYLFVERSGLSLELNKLKKEGILLYRDGEFTFPKKKATVR
jgi:CRP/FNR family transcriptional regulator, dissimilatory nitrate respiration regulator